MVDNFYPLVRVALKIWSTLIVYIFNEFSILMDIIKIEDSSSVQTKDYYQYANVCNPS